MRLIFEEIEWWWTAVLNPSVCEMYGASVSVNYDRKYNEKDISDFF